MASVKISEDLYAVGVLNPNLRIFDIVMETEFGTSYNAYLIRGSEKTALVETCHSTYFDQFLKNIQEICPLEEIDYVICNHTEPDHSGALAELLKHNPELTVLASQAGTLYLKNITNANMNIRAVKDGETLDLGGRTLKFISAPFLHWSDSMFTWDETSKTLFSCDFLGSHYCEPYTFDYNMAYPDKYEKAFKGYYDAIFGPFPSYVVKGLDKIDALDVKTVCTSHGPVLTDGCRFAYTKEKYREWSKPHVNEKTTIPIFYCTAYGNTGMIAGAIRDGIQEVLPDALVETFDLVHEDMSEMQYRLNTSNAFAVGTPTINKDAVPPIMVLLSHVDAVNNQKKPCLAFGSYGWSGEGVPNVVTRLQGLKLNVFGEGFRTIFVPSEDDLKKARELGKEFAATLK